MSARVLGALSICVSAALWGLDGVVLTPRLYNLDVLFVVFLLHAVPFLLMQPFLFAAYRPLARLGGREWVNLVSVALAGGVVGTYAIVRALFLVDFNQLSVVVLLQKLQPVFAIALAALLLQERLSRRFVGRALLALGGAYLLTFGLGVPQTGASSEAVLWALVAAFAFGAGTVLGKRLLASLDFKTATFARYGVTTLVTLAYLLIVRGELPLAQVSPDNWAIIFLIAVTTGSGAIFLYYFGLSRVRARVSAICEMCLPLSAILLDYLINRSLLGPWQWVGAAVLLAAILLVSVGSAPEPATETV